MSTPMTKIREFKECDTCSKKVGAITLCEGCVNNRAVIDHFQQELSSLEGEIENSIRDKVTGGFPGEMEMNIEIATYNEAVRDVLAIIRQHKER